ncbi:Hypothetical predicted protein, partial [Podarcis lilfordi]
LLNPDGGPGQEEELSAIVDLPPEMNGSEGESALHGQEQCRFPKACGEAIDDCSFSAGIGCTILTFDRSRVQALCHLPLPFVRQRGFY